VLGEDIANLSADRLVDFEAWLDEDQVRTLSFRGDRRHSRANAVLASFVARGGDDAALGRTAHCHRLAAQVRIIALLDRRVKGIHVDMDDLAVSRRRKADFRIG
jgi:hypothetical protein